MSTVMGPQDPRDAQWYQQEEGYARNTESPWPEEYGRDDGYEHQETYLLEEEREQNPYEQEPEHEREPCYMREPGYEQDGGYVREPAPNWRQRPVQLLAEPVHDGMAVASLVLSLVWLGGLGSLLAIIFGAMSQTEASRAKRRASGLATAGVILGCIGLMGTVLLVFGYIGSKPDPTQQWINCVNSQINNPNITCPSGP